MNHKQAEELQLAVKYVLGELPPVQRDEYEDHYIDCPECARDVHAAAAFADTAREVFRREAQNEAPAKAGEPQRGGWLAWLRPVVAVPAMAALLLVIGYQNAVTIPEAKKEAGLRSGQFFTSSYSLQMANVRGGEEVKVQAHRNQALALDFDFVPAQAFDSYLCQLQDANGRSLLQVKVPGSSTNKEAHLVVPAGLVQPGNYSLVFTGMPSGNGQRAGNEVLRLGFSVEFLR